MRTLWNKVLESMRKNEQSPSHAAFATKPENGEPIAVVLVTQYPELVELIHAFFEKAYQEGTAARGTGPVPRLDKECQ